MEINYCRYNYHKNNAIVTDDGIVFTYKNLFDFASILYSKINHRCLVFCLCQNSIDSLVGYVSFLSNRVVPLMLDACLDTALLEELIGRYKPEFIWMPSDKKKDFPDKELVYSTNHYSLVRINNENFYELHENLALLLTTSGSTGSPKLVRLTYDNIQSNAEAIAEYLSINEEERPITTLPMHYSYGLSIINSHLLKGATILLTDKSLMEKEFWAFLKEQKATSMSGVPYTYQMLKRLRFFRMDLPFLKTMTQAGGKLNSELNKEFSDYCQRNGKRFFVMYGQTEATARMSYLPYKQALHKLESVGIAIPGGEFSLIDEQGLLIAYHEKIGELVYKGRNVSMGYAECGDDLSKGDENLGILYTGDLAKRDKDGYYYIVGRKKRFIKLFGNRVNLDETEHLLKNLISECACIGSDDQMLIYITQSGREDEVRKYVSLKTGIHQSAFFVKCIESIPKNSSGKTIYSMLEN